MYIVLKMFYQEIFQTHLITDSTSEAKQKAESNEPLPADYRLVSIDLPALNIFFDQSWIYIP